TTGIGSVRAVAASLQLAGLRLSPPSAIRHPKSYVGFGYSQIGARRPPPDPLLPFAPAARGTAIQRKRSVGPLARGTSTLASRSTKPLRRLANSPTGKSASVCAPRCRPCEVTPKPAGAGSQGAALQ